MSRQKLTPAVDESPEPDAFIRTVEAAMERLSRARGRRVSVRSLVRDAGFPDDHPDAGRVRARFFYHLNRKRPWPEGHQVPADLVRQFASVLPISEDELMRAAQSAAGFDVEVPDGPDRHVQALACFLIDDGVPPEEKARILADLTALVAEQVARWRAAIERHAVPEPRGIRPGPDTLREAAAAG